MKIFQHENFYYENFYYENFITRKFPDLQYLNYESSLARNFYIDLWCYKFVVHFI